MYTLIVLSTYTLLNMISYHFFQQGVVPDLELVDLFIFGWAIVTDVLGLVTKIRKV